jgi:para-aminobenzoate synthetase component 1
MTSTVVADLSSSIGLHDLFAALFPCGSVTGAPKIRAMEIIRELEATPRGVYCGAIGWIAPSGNMSFNVAIRTLTCFADGSAVFNVGSGIVADSTAAAEYDECLLKSRFLHTPGLA